MPGIESQPTSASNGGLFSSTSPEKGYPYPGQNEVNSEIEKRGIERISKADRETIVGLDLGLRERAKLKNKSTNDKDFTPNFVVDGYYWKPSRPDQYKTITIEEAIPRLAQTVDAIDSLNQRNLAEDLVVVRDTRRGLKIFLQEVIKKNNGEPLSPYRQYRKDVSGTEPHLIPPNVLDEGLLTVADLLQRMGEVYSGQTITDETLRRAVARRSEHTKLNESDYKNAFRRAEFRNRARLSEILNYDLSKVEFDFAWENDDAFWLFWEDMGIDGDRLRANRNERHESKRDQGYAGMYGGHEPAHFYQGHIVRNEIRTGKLDPSVGLQLIPVSTCYHLEGMAQTVGDLAGFETTLDEKLAVEVYRLEKRVLNNGLYFAEEGNSLDDIAKYMKRFTLKNTQAENKKLLIEGTTQPFERAYLPIYGISDYDIMQVKDNLGDISKLLPYWFRRPQTPDQLLPRQLRQLIKYAA
jgi:hypothetical protein